LFTFILSNFYSFKFLFFQLFDLQAEARKCEKYSHLAPSHLFQPVAIEISGVIGHNSLSFWIALGNLLTQESGEARSNSYLSEFISGSAVGECSGHPELLGKLTCPPFLPFIVL